MFAFTSQLIILAFAAVAAVAAPAKSGAVPSNCDRVYLVKSGDNCNSIGAAQGAPTLQIINSNEGAINAQCTNLQVSEIICLGLQNQDCSTVHVVKSGEVCNTIANNAGIPLSTLLGNNPNIDANCDNLTPGEVLCTSGHIFN